MSEVSNLPSVLSASWTIPDKISQHLPSLNRQISRSRRYTLKYVARLGTMTAAMSAPGFTVTRDFVIVHFETPFRVGSSERPAGTFKVTWIGAGPEVQVSLAQSKKVIATASAKSTQANNEVLTSHTSNGAVIETTTKGTVAVLQGLLLPHDHLSCGDNVGFDQ